MGGLITEASPLNFPEGASLVDQNMEMWNDGSRRRRKGLRIDPNSPILGENISEDESAIVRAFYWRKASKTGDVDLLVVIDGATIRFFRDESVSDESDFVEVGEYDLSMTFPPAEELFFTTIQNFLIITGRAESVEIAEYDDNNHEVEFSSLRLKTRDLWGVDTPYAPDERPEFDNMTDELKSLHGYNLYNNGFPAGAEVFLRYWPFGEEQENQDDPTVRTYDIIRVFRDWTSRSDVEGQETGIGRMFAASDIWTEGVIEDPGVIEDAWGTWSPHTFLSNSPSPTSKLVSRGRFVLDLFNRGESRKEQVLRLQEKIDPEDPLPSYLNVDHYPIDRSSGRITASAAYAGRVFYTVQENLRTETDDRTPSLQNFIFFSQSVKNKEDIAKCHGEQDPSSLESPDTLATDGGFISIQGMGTVRAMETLGSSLFVIADNGVWEVSGGQSVFSATNLSVNRVTNTGAEGAHGVVSLKDMILFVSTDGINSIQIDPRDRQPVVEDLTQDKIRAFFTDKSEFIKSKMRGMFYEEADQVRWLFNSDQEGAENNTYANELIFELQYGAFRINKYHPDVGIKGYANRRKGVEFLRRVSEGGELELRLSDFKPGPSSTNGEVDNLFSDDGYGGLGAEETPAIVVTGSNTGGAPSSEKRIGGHFVVHMGRTEDETIEVDGGTTPLNPSSCIAQAQWGWHTSPSGNKWSRPQQVYRLPRFFTPNEGSDSYDIGYSIITTKNRLRGRGKALSIRFSSEEGKNMVLYGWGLEWIVKERY